MLSTVVLFQPQHVHLVPPTLPVSDFPLGFYGYSKPTAKGSYAITEKSFYVNADLTLEVHSNEGQKVHLQVASTALCIASPVFRAMLSPNRFKEGNTLASCTRKGEMCILPLPDDDPGALTILCDIIHFNNFKVPRDISTETLARLCILLDKYVCTLAAASWIDYWFSHMPCTSSTHCSFDMQDANPAAQLDDIMWSFISLVVGDRQKFERFTASQIMKLGPRDCMGSEQREWFDRLPSRVQESIYSNREIAIKQVAQILEEFCSGKLSKCVMAPDQARARLSPPGPPTARDCEAHSIGAFIQLLRSESHDQESQLPALPQLVQPSSWRGSVDELLHHLEKIAQELGRERTLTTPHHQCLHGRALYRKLRELRVSLYAQGLELADFRGGRKSRRE